MLITELPEDVLTVIIEKLDNATPFVRTCRHLREVGNRHGYKKHLHYHHGDDVEKFRQEFLMHSRVVQSIIIDGLQDTNDWLPVYPKRILLNIMSAPFYVGQAPTYTFDPPAPTTTSELYIIATRKSPCLVKINWSMFPLLKILYVNAYSVDVEGIENLKNLRELSIDLGNGRYQNSPLTEKIANLPMLQLLNVNADIDEETMRKLVRKGINVNLEPRYNPDYEKLHMYLVTNRTAESS